MSSTTTAQESVATATILSRLRQLGEPDRQRGSKWRDYLAMGVRHEHVEALTELVTHEWIKEAGEFVEPEGWAPLHAWRALGQLRDPAAIAPLLGVLDKVDEADEDWALDEIPEVLAMIGEPAIDPAIAFMRDETHRQWARLACATALSYVGKRASEHRQRCVDAIAQTLDEAKGENSPEMNAFLIGDLMDMKAAEAADVIERTFRTAEVDLVRQR